MSTTVKKAYAHAKDVRNNWYTAFKGGIAMKGYEYYKIPDNIRYRYPAPGSVPLDDRSYHHLFKKHWKTPFRDSHFNIRTKDNMISFEENCDASLSHRPDVSHIPQLAGAANQPTFDDLTIDEEKFDGKGPDHPDRLAELQSAFEHSAIQEQHDALHYSDYHGDYDHEYNVVNVTWDKDLGFAGFYNDPRSKQMFAEMEMWIEEIQGERQIRENKVQFYKGTVKKWQVLDDDAFDRDQIEKLQAAVQAPLPEELEMY